MRKVQWCVKCKKYHLFDDVNWKYNWKQRTWECLKTEDLKEEKVMKATGIVRRVDDLGRIVIPKNVRTEQGITEGTPMEIFTEDGAVIFKKYATYLEEE